MIDIHCHILPGIDDGVCSHKDFMDMACTAVGNGITDIIATPHHRDGIYYNDRLKIERSIAFYQQKLDVALIPLKIHGGQEIRLHQNFIQNLRCDLLTLNNNGKYLLIELPSAFIPDYTFDVLYELRLKGYVPIIAHPERNKVIIRNSIILDDFVREGALIQLTSGSILGFFGRRVKAFSHALIAQRLVHFVATDAHDLIKRNFNLKEAYHSISTEFGLEQSEILQQNARKALNGGSIPITEPNFFVKKRRRFL